MSELELKLRRILETMLAEAPADEGGRAEGLARFRRQGDLLVEKARARSGDIAAYRLQEIVDSLLAEYEPSEQDGDGDVAGAWEAFGPEADLAADLAADAAQGEDVPPAQSSKREAGIGRRFPAIPAIPAIGDMRSFAMGFGLAALVAILCSGLAWAVFAPVPPGLAIPRSDVEAAVPILDEVRQALGEVAARIEAGLPADNPVMKNPGRFVGVPGAFPDIYRTLSPDARRSGNLITRVDDGGYKVLSQGRLCPLAAQKYPDMIDRHREGDISRLCLSFGYWNDKGKAF